MNETSPLEIDGELEARLAALAARTNQTVGTLAQGVLRAHVDEQERLRTELGDDERRWQRYLETGHIISFASVRKRIRVLAAEASHKATLPQSHTMTRVGFLPEALEDVERLFVFLVQANPVAAQKAMLAIDEGIELLEENPRMRARCTTLRHTAS